MEREHKHEAAPAPQPASPDHGEHQQTHAKSASRSALARETTAPEPIAKPRGIGVPAGTPAPAVKPPESGGPIATGPVGEVCAAADLATASLAHNPAPDGGHVASHISEMYRRAERLPRRIEESEIGAIARSLDRLETALDGRVSDPHAARNRASVKEFRELYGISARAAAVATPTAVSSSAGVLLEGVLDDLQEALGTLVAANEEADVKAAVDVLEERLDYAYWTVSELGADVAPVTKIATKIILTSSKMIEQLRETKRLELYKHVEPRLAELCRVAKVAVPSMDTTTTAGHLDFEAAFEEISAKMHAFEVASLVYQSVNWAYFFGHTSSNPRLSSPQLGVSIAKKVGSKLFGKAINEVTDVAKDAIKAKLGFSALKKAAKSTWIGAIASGVYDGTLGFLLELWLGPDTGAADKGRHDGAMLAAEQIQAQIMALYAETGTSVADMLQGFTTLKASITSDEEIAELIAKMREASSAFEELPKIDGNYDLGKELLKEWLISNAGEPDHRGRHVGSDDWSLAKKEVYGDEDADIKDIGMFIKQTEAHFDRMGFAPDAVAPVIAELNKDFAHDNADDVIAAVEARTYSFTAPVVAADRLSTSLAKESPFKIAYETIPLLAFAGVTAQLKIDLEYESESIYVHGWDYELHANLPTDMPAFYIENKDPIIGDSIPRIEQTNDLSLSFSPDHDMIFDGAKALKDDVL